jgi:[acyl-carrier-protein] S-malonyltransferase
MRKSALLFPGQGSQYVSMGQSNDNNYAFVREIWEEANDILQFDIRRLCLEGPKHKLMQTQFTQPALFVVQYTAYQVLLHRSDYAIDYVAGHSLGEISALACAGAVEFRDGLNIVHTRGLLMHESGHDMQGRMAAIRGLDENTIDNLCRRCTDSDGKVVIACKNAPDQYVISGSVKSVEKVVSYVRDYKGHAIDLHVSAAFHSPYMKSAAHRFEQALKLYTYNKPKCTVMSNVTGEPYQDESEIVNNLVMQFTHPVEWMSTLQYLSGQGVQLFIDIGPGRVLKDLVGRNELQGAVYAVDTTEDYSELIRTASEDRNY